MYKALFYFYNQCVEKEELDLIKESVIIELTSLIISGKLASKLQRLCRFATIKDEMQLAKRCFENQGRTLADIGVEKIFQLNNHLEYFDDEENAGKKQMVLNMRDMYRPYNKAIKLMKAVGKSREKGP